MKNKNEPSQLPSDNFYDESPDGKEESRNRSELNNYDRFAEDEEQFEEDEITEDSFDEDSEENRMNFYNSSSVDQLNPKLKRKFK